VSPFELIFFSECWLRNELVGFGWNMLHAVPIPIAQLIFPETKASGAELAILVQAWWMLLHQH